MPHPKELKSFSIGGNDGLGALIAGLMKVVETMRAAKTE
jgi:hypothetical protein